MTFKVTPFGRTAAIRSRLTSSSTKPCASPGGLQAHAATRTPTSPCHTHRRLEIDRPPLNLFLQNPLQRARDIARAGHAPSGLTSRHGGKQKPRTSSMFLKRAPFIIAYPKAKVFKQQRKVQKEGKGLSHLTRLTSAMLLRDRGFVGPRRGRASLCNRRRTLEWHVTKAKLPRLRILVYKEIHLPFGRTLAQNNPEPSMGFFF